MLTLGLLAALSTWANNGDALEQGQVELRQLATAAKTIFQQRLEPPVTRLTVFNIASRERFTPYRQYLVNEYVEAIDALLDEATSPDSARQVEAALSEIVENGRVTQAEAIFTAALERDAKQAPALAAAAARHCAALAELPAAMAPMTKRPDEPLPFKPLGERAYPLYLRASVLDPNHPWTWILLAFLGPTSGFDAALAEAEGSALATTDVHALIVARLARASFDQARGRDAETEATYLAARAAAEQWLREAPAETRRKRDLAWCWSRIADAREAQNRNADAQAACNEALNLRAHIAVAESNSVQSQLDVIAAQVCLSRLKGNMDEAQKHFREA